MDTIILSLSSLLLTSALCWSWKQRRNGARKYRDAYVSRLDEVARGAELTQRACFTSLDNLHGRLESLQSRTATAEQRLGSFVEAPQLERKEHFQAAALLLAGGSPVERVAALLGMPIGQVELVQELRKFAVHAPAAPAPQETPAAAKAVRRRVKKRKPRVQKLQRVRPILLTDVVRFDGAANGKAEAAA
jgi:hypothetical protein